jgi:competence protein ComGC
MDKSMEKIDVIKLLIYLLVLIVVTLFMILFVIIPNVREYKESQLIDKKASVHQDRVQNILSDRNIELSNLSSENRRAIIAFMHEFSADSFMDYAAKFFTQVSLVQLDKKAHKEEFVEYELKVTTSLKSPVNFYQFLEGLNRYENIVQADFPIYMESNESKISTVFTIKVFDINSTK